MPAITAISTAFPRTASQTDLWESFFKDHYANNPLARRFFSSAGVSTRHAAVMPPLENSSHWSTEERMRRFVPEAFTLARRAVEDALAHAHVEAGAVGELIVVTCTGYSTPGLDSMIADELHMPATTERVVIGHMGCHAALPALARAHEFVSVRRQAAVVVCVELASIHLQPPTSDTDQMVVHSLFGDGASAAVIVPNAQDGLELIDTLSITDAGASELMTWHITNHGFRMQLSQRVPEVLSKHIGPAVDTLLTRNNLTTDGIAHWAAHPGGPRILDVTGDQLRLKPQQLEASRQVLAKHGNCSSATVLMVIDQMQRDSSPHQGDYVVALAFGPGLTLYCSLLRQQ